MRSENINIKISRLSRDNQKVEQIKRSKTSQYKKSRLFEEWGGGDDYENMERKKWKIWHQLGKFFTKKLYIFPNSANIK